MKGDVFVKRLEQQDPRLGRHVVHDERSRGFTLSVSVDRSTWRDKRVRIYDPVPNPNQSIGNCTGCAKAMQLNAAGNRVSGTVLKMRNADNIYSLATSLDPWEGAYPPDDTGSSGLAAAKAAKQMGLAGEYRWLFGGADEVVQAVMAGDVVNVGTAWYWDMFTQVEVGSEGFGRVRVSGGEAGGHEWSVRGYDLSSDYVLGRCWWGSFRDFWIRRTDLQDLLMDSGDALVQSRT